MRVILMFCLLLALAIPVSAQDPTPPVVVMTGDSDLVQDLIPIGALLISIAALVLVAYRSGQSADPKIVEKLIEFQQNRPQIDRYELMYEQANINAKRAFDIAIAVLGAIAPLTNIKADDKLVDIGIDIQTPDAPTTTTVTPTPPGPVASNPSSTGRGIASPPES